MSRACERHVEYMDPKSAFEDRRLFVRNLGEFLTQTREGVIGCELSEKDIVSVYFIGGCTKTANVHLDSYAAIVKDVMNQVF